MPSTNLLSIYYLHFSLLAFIVMVFSYLFNFLRETSTFYGFDVVAISTISLFRALSISASKGYNGGA